jgi:hypothetical protein
MPGAQQPARWRRPDTGQQESLVSFALVLSGGRVTGTHLASSGPLRRRANRKRTHPEALPVYEIESVTQTHPDEAGPPSLLGESYWSEQAYVYIQAQARHDGRYWLVGTLPRRILGLHTCGRRCRR